MIGRSRKTRDCFPSHTVAPDEEVFPQTEQFASFYCSDLSGKSGDAYLLPMA
jgi:hypothetical protein